MTVLYVLLLYALGRDVLYITSRLFLTEAPYLGLVFQLNQLRRLHPSRSCVSSSKKLMNFMHFHNSST